MRSRLLQIGIVFLLLAALIGTAFADLTDKEITEKVNALVAQMTLEEKAGQMTQMEWVRLGYDTNVTQYKLGALLNGGGVVPYDNNPQGWFELVDKYQAFATNTRLKIPLIYGIDAVHGNNNVEGAVIFPHNIGLGCTRNPALVEKAARATAEEVVATGIKWTFAPCVAVSQDERWGRTYESFSEEPTLVSQLGTAAIRGYQGTNIHDATSILACAKHFLADGGTKGGVDRGNAVITEAQIRKIYLPPYEAAVKAGVKSIMVSLSEINGERMHGNKHLITGVLKGELKFTGFVVSDWAGIKDLPGNLKDQVELAINAGIDMVMVPDDLMFVNHLISLVNEKKVSMERIDDAVRRILKVKYQIGLMEKPFLDRSYTNLFGTVEHRQIGRECVRQSIVLLKNDKKALPLSKKIKKIVLAGKTADNLGYQCGGWTISWQGDSGNTTKGTTLLNAVKNAVPEADVIISTNSGDIASADAVIAAIGEKPYAEVDGDRKDLSLDADDMAALRLLKKSGAKKIVTILFSGRPMIINDALKISDAFLAAWLPGTEGDGIADVIFGDYKPTGKLSFTWPKSMAQIPINFGDNKVGLFPFGYGLTYK